MTGRTHAMAGVAAVWLLTPLPTVPPRAVGPLVVLAALGALLPDLDAEEAKIKHVGLYGVKPLLPLAVMTHRTFGHRGLLHSLLGLGAVGLLTLPLALHGQGPAGLALLLGYASHLAADACTPSGIPLLYPTKRRYHLLPKGWRLATGSTGEHLLFPLLAALALGLLLHALAAWLPPEAYP